MKSLRLLLSLPALFVVLGFLVVPPGLSAQERPVHPKMERFLGPDGDILTPFSSDSEKGELPSAAADGDEFWDDRFGSLLGNTGVDDEVFAMVSNGEKLFVAGSFSQAGEIEVSNIALWNGSEFQHVGFPGALQGTNGIVNDMAVHNGDTLFVAGQFTVAASKPVNNIAWFQISTGSWVDLGGGVKADEGNAFIADLFLDGDLLYVGGRFDRAGNREAKNIAVYNIRSKRWQDLGGGVNGDVNAIAMGPDGLYIGGTFTAAGEVNANGVVRWDGTEWHALAGGGVNGTVNAIAVWETAVFVGGSFSQAGGVATQNIARWQSDSSKWSDLSGLFWLSLTEAQELESDGVTGDVRTLLMQGQELYVGGTFKTAFPGDYTVDEITVQYIARWYESTGDPLFNTLWWKGLGQGMNGFVNTIVEHDGELYAGGAFTKAGGTPARGIAKWDGLRWFSLASGVGNFISTMAINDGNVYVGGEFDQPGKGRGTRLARLNESIWTLIPGEFSGSIFTVESKDEFIYVGGSFSSIGGKRIENAARYNTETGIWSGLGEKDGPTKTEGKSYVSSFGFQDGLVYVGGDFSSAGEMPARGLASWDPASDTWDDVGGGINGQVFGIESLGGDLYVGGRFLGAGSVADLNERNIARWDGSEWYDLDSGTSEVIWTMGTYGDDLMVGGDFDSAGSVATQYLARWNTTSGGWDNVNGGVAKDFLPTVNAIVTNGPLLYVGGYFDSIAGVPSRNIARFDGSSWAPLGSGVDNFVFTMAADRGKLYVAGAFAQAGGKPSIYFGIFTDPLLSVESDRGTASRDLDLSAFPSPSNGPITFSFRTNSTGPVALRVYNAQGEEIETVIEQTLPEGSHRIVWQNAVDLPAGAYLYRLTTERGIESGGIVVR